MKLTLIGPPGAGKTTLGVELARRLDVLYVSSGELARKSGFLGSQAESSGQLDPDEDKIQKLVREAVAGETDYILDGFPRMVGQYHKIGIEIDRAIHLSAPWRLCNARLMARGRSDDAPGVIRARFKTYNETTRPLVRVYAAKNILWTIDAGGTKSGVVLSALTGLVQDQKVRDYLSEAIKTHEDAQGVQGKTARFRRRASERRHSLSALADQVARATIGEDI